MKRSSKRSIASLAQMIGLLGLALLGYYFTTGNSTKNSPATEQKASHESPDEVEESAGDPTLTKIVPEKSFAGVTLFPLSGVDQVQLLDYRGKVVHSWPVDATRSRLLPDCSLLVVHGSKYGLRKKKWRELKKNIRRYDWDGEIIWEHSSENWFHHDIHLLPNNNILTLERLDLEFPEDHPFKPKNGEGVFRSDAVVEISPQGEKVWEWLAHEHLDTVSCGWNGCEKKRTRQKGKMVWDWSHTNTVQPVPPNKWFDAGDLRFRPGNFFLLPRSFWTAYLIDRASGEVVWSYEGEKENGTLTEAIVRGHEVHMIPEGIPGAGNVLILDNGYEKIREYSRVLEINPITQETVWKYEAGNDFYTYGGGSIERLPNGNTFISEDVRGRAFEVTPDGEVVWEVKGEHRISRARRMAFDYCDKFSQFADS